MPDKYVLLSKVEELLVYAGQENFFQDGGFSNLQDFKITTHPEWSFKISDLVLTKEILLLNGENAILTKYIIGGHEDCKIVLRPLLAYRNFHDLQHENISLNQKLEIFTNGFSCAPYPGLPKIFFETNVKFESFAQHDHVNSRKQSFPIKNE